MSGKNLKNKKIKNKKRDDKFLIPKWMECTWRRVACGKDSCPICGQIKKSQQKHLERDEDPYSLEVILEDMSQSLKEVLEIIKKDCETKEIKLANIDAVQEPPKPIEFRLYNKVNDWRNKVFAATDKADDVGEIWIYSDTLQDLVWYTNLLPAKVYRQLCNRWHLQIGDGYGEFDYQYTQNVLDECLKILKRTLEELSSYDSNLKINFVLIHHELLDLEKEIKKI